MENMKFDPLRNVVAEDAETLANLQRRRLLKFSIASMLAAPGLARAQEVPRVPGYPNRAIKVIQIAGPGSSLDNVTRLVVHPIDQALGQPVVAEYRAGDGGSIAMTHGAKVPPDGYNFVSSASAATVLRPLFDSKINYDMERDYVSVATLSRQPMLLIVNPSLNVKDAKELIALLKSRPGQYSYPSAGTGATSHIAAELFKKTYGVDILHVPYKSAPQLNTDFMGGQVQVMFSAPNTVAAFLQSGRMKALAVASQQRLPSAPDVPTFEELGLPAMHAETIFTLLAPTGTPKPIVDLLNFEINKVLRMANVIKALGDQGALPGSGSAADASKLLSNERAKWGPIIRALDLKTS